MIDLENANLEFTVQRERLKTVFRAELTICAEASIGPEFDVEGQRPNAERELRGQLQEIVYGDLIKAILAAHHTSLQAAGESYQRVKAAFDPVIKLLKITIPASGD